MRTRSPSWQRWHKQRTAEGGSAVNEVTELWRDYRHAEQERKASERDVRTKEIVKLTEQGYIVKVLTAYHFRINGKLDLYPTNRHFHFLPTRTRGRYKVALDVAQQFFGKQS